MSQRVSCHQGKDVWSKGEVVPLVQPLVPHVDCSEVLDVMASPGLGVVHGFQVVKCLDWSTVFFQGKNSCGLEGRDCIERNSNRVFNCNITCNGIYADVHKIDEPLTKDNKTGKGTDKKKFQILIEEYRRLKKNYVQHFRLSSAYNKTVFGWAGHTPDGNIVSNISGNLKLYI